MSMRIEQNMANDLTYKNNTNEWELFRDIKSPLHLYLNNPPPPPKGSLEERLTVAATANHFELFSAFI